jgi:signal transduction histidine kinase
MPQRRGTLIGVFGLAVLALLVTVNVVYRLAFDDLRDSLDRRFGDQLTGLAEALADGIGADEALDLMGEEFDPATYIKVHDLMRTFAEGNRLASVALLDTLWNDPFADSPDSLGRLVQSLLDREGQWALMSGLTWTSPTYQWGDTFYRTTAAPIVDEVTGRTVAIVRLEVDAAYLGPLGRLATVAALIHVSSAVLAILLVGLFAWYTYRMRIWDERLQHSERLIGLGRLAATIAHEIKNPLGIIKATAQRLERVKDEKKRAELLRFIPEETERLNRILTGYLSIASPKQAQPERVPIAKSLPRWMDETFGRSDQERGRWQVNVEGTEPIQADPDAPKQVLINLINNALDVTAKDQIVEVRWEASGERRGRLTVTDRGPGIPRKLRERVFEPFYTTKAKGSGLGLHAVRMMVERDGGRVWIEDAPGGGARFVVEWPLAREDTAKA